MQKWLLEEFDASASVTPVAPPETAHWDSLPAEAAGPRFHKESRFADPTSLMSHLTQAERAMIFDLVEQDVAAEYDEREVALKTRQAEELAAAQADFDARLQGWLEQFATGLAAHCDERLHEMAQASARLAIQLAGKIVRAQVPLDPAILERSLQTALYKAPSGQALTVRLNPEDAEWLRAQDELRKRLGIDAVEPDRRIERGGCVVQAGQGEWDATLGGQLESLGEIIHEAIATAEHDPARALRIPDLPPAGTTGTESDDDPALD